MKSAGMGSGRDLGSIAVQSDFPVVELGIVIAIANCLSFALMMCLWHTCKSASKWLINLLVFLLILLLFILAIVAVNQAMKGGLGHLLEAMWDSSFLDLAWAACKRWIPGLSAAKS